MDHLPDPLLVDLLEWNAAYLWYHAPCISKRFYAALKRTRTVLAIHRILGELPDSISIGPSVILHSLMLPEPKIYRTVYFRGKAGDVVHLHKIRLSAIAHVEGEATFILRTERGAIQTFTNLPRMKPDPLLPDFLEGDTLLPLFSALGAVLLSDQLIVRYVFYSTELTATLADYHRASQDRLGDLVTEEYE